MLLPLLTKSPFKPRHYSIPHIFLTEVSLSSELEVTNNFVYDQAPMDIDVKLRTRVLPQTPVQPSYEEPPYFIPVVLAFAFFNTFYLTLALIVAFWSFDEIAHMGDWFGRVSLWSLFGLIFFPVHLISYKWYAHHREHAYLRSFTLGVDIDGVLNKHRDHFSKLLKENVGTERDPDSFTTIPLHECPAIGVSREDEKQVFNNPRYWTEMPLMDDAAQNLERLQNLNLKVHIFSHRPWPNTSGMSQNNRKAIHQQWNTQALSFTRRVYGKKSLRSLFDRVRLWIGTSELEASRIPWFRLDKGTLSWLRRAQARLGTAPIDQFTKCWLRLQGIDHDELTIEQGNEDVADPQGHFRNRFYISRQKKIRFFVEDHLEKAIKLAYICDVVFLVEQPYNRNSRDKCLECERECKLEILEVPNNVLRVKSWDEIYKHIRRLA